MAPGAEGNLGGGEYDLASGPLAGPRLSSSLHKCLTHFGASSLYVTETDGYPEELCVSVPMLQ